MKGSQRNVWRVICALLLVLFLFTESRAQSDLFGTWKGELLRSHPLIESSKVGIGGISQGAFALCMNFTEPEILPTGIKPKISSSTQNTIF